MEITAREFEEKVLQCPRPALVDFWGSWCIPCKQMEPVVQQLTESELDIAVFSVNINRNPGLRARYRISGVPTFVLFRNGQELGRAVGAQTPEQLVEFIRSHVA